MKSEEIKNGCQIQFKEDPLPYTVKGANARHAVCVRKLSRRHDAKLLHHKVEMGAYMSFMEAYKALKHEPVYTIIDFDKWIRGPHDLVFNVYDFDNASSVSDLLIDLSAGKTNLSSRNIIPLRINNIKH